MNTIMGTLRIGKDLRVYEKTKTRWKHTSADLPDALQVAHLFKANHALGELIDQKNPRFLKGQLSPQGQIQGARITILPTGEPVDKAYSLFAKHLTLHDQTSHGHWDLIYQNPGGTFAYCYALAKRNASIKNKYKKVQAFNEHYPTLYRAVTKALEDTQDYLALPMYTLLKTYMRVGNEVYYKAHNHKGLTTLTKEDIRIHNAAVTFEYLSKGGVPVTLTETFPEPYIQRLKSHMRKLHATDFVFTDTRGKPLKDTHFMKAFERYCGESFYPHIVRSYYATQQAKTFLATHKKASKQEVTALFTSIANKLGHKRFAKKENEWKDSYTVTIHHYLEPATFSKINKLLT